MYIIGMQPRHRKYQYNNKSIHPAMKYSPMLVLTISIQGCHSNFISVDIHRVD